MMISNFMVDQDQLETNLLQLFAYSKDSEWFSITFVFIFEVTIVDEKTKTSLVTILLLFICFLCPQLFTSSLPYRCSDVPDHII